MPQLHSRRDVARIRLRWVDSAHDVFGLNRYPIGSVRMYKVRRLEGEIVNEKERSGRWES
jgi:hypothetical protein